MSSCQGALWDAKAGAGDRYGVNSTVGLAVYATFDANRLAGDAEGLLGRESGARTA